ncbi:MAG: hypothetical protein HKN17_03610, partial [Rhodothermales bacterium]|nr:hypothetical protein [Rhodothermales bacterium]
MPRVQFFLILFCALLAAPSCAQEPADVSYPAAFDEPMPLYTEALGDFTRPASTESDEARAYFDQGFQMMYAFAKEDAARSFRESWKRDPTCAICYWGEAWAWGPYLNGGMREAEAPRARAAAVRAAELAPDHASAIERELIDAMLVRYAEPGDDRDQAVRDSAYADAMRGLYERHPDDLDVGTLYAEALFLLEPRRGDRDLDDPDVQRLHGVLEDVLEKDIRHVGACHLYIHATESTPRPDLAEPCAEYIGTSIPGASHINHMPSHTWSEVGRWGDSVEANLMAWHSDMKADVGEGFAIYPSHNLHMLLFAASMDGQGATAMQAGRDYSDITDNTMYEVLTLVRFGRYDQIERVEERSDHDVHGGMWDFSQGIARVRDGDIDEARQFLDRILDEAGSSDARFRFHSAEHLLGTVGALLEGEIHRAEGDLDTAITAFERAAAIEDELMYDEPEPLPFAARHWLGHALLEADRPADAERVYLEDLDDHPRNG